MPRKRRTAGNELTATLSVRISARTRYGIFLLSRKGLEKPSEVVQGMLSVLLNSKTHLFDGYQLPELDELWDPVPWVRLKKLRATHPSWMSSAELNAVETVLEYGDRMNAEVWQSLLDMHGFEF